MDRVAALRSKKLRRGAFYMRPSVVSRFAGGYAIRPCVFVLAPGPKLHLLYYLLFLIFYLYNFSFSFTSLTCRITLAFVGPP